MTIQLNKKDHIYTEIETGRKIISVSDILTENGLNDFSMVNPAVLARAMQFGNATHLTCEYSDKGILNYDTVDKSILPYLEAWKKYLKEWDVEILEIENSLHSKTWGFCGTPDRIVLEKGILTIPDIKTVSVLTKGVGLQLAAYKIAWEEENKKLKNKIKQRIAVQLKADGTYNRKLYTDKNDINVFKSMLTVRGWKINNKFIKE